MKINWKENEKNIARLANTSDKKFVSQTSADENGYYKETWKVFPSNTQVTVIRKLY